MIHLLKLTMEELSLLKCLLILPYPVSLVEVLGILLHLEIPSLLLHLVSLLPLQLPLTLKLQHGLICSLELAGLLLFPLLA